MHGDKSSNLGKPINQKQSSSLSKNYAIITSKRISFKEFGKDGAHTELFRKTSSFSDAIEDDENSTFKEIKPLNSHESEKQTKSLHIATNSELSSQIHSESKNLTNKEGTFGPDDVKVNKVNKQNDFTQGKENMCKISGNSEAFVPIVCSSKETSGSSAEWQCHLEATPQSAKGKSSDYELLSSSTESTSTLHNKNELCNIPGPNSFNGNRFNKNTLKTTETRQHVSDETPLGRLSSSSNKFTKHFRKSSSAQRSERPSFVIRKVATFRGLTAIDNGTNALNKKRSLSGTAIDSNARKKTKSRQIDAKATFQRLIERSSIKRITSPVVPVIKNKKEIHHIIDKNRIGVGLLNQSKDTQGSELSLNSKTRQIIKQNLQNRFPDKNVTTSVLSTHQIMPDTSTKNVEKSAIDMVKSNEMFIFSEAGPISSQNLNIKNLSKLEPQVIPKTLPFELNLHFTECSSQNAPNGTDVNSSTQGYNLVSQCTPYELRPWLHDQQISVESVNIIEKSKTFINTEICLDARFELGTQNLLCEINKPIELEVWTSDSLEAVDRDRLLEINRKPVELETCLLGTSLQSYKPVNFQSYSDPSIPVHLEKHSLDIPIIEESNLLTKSYLNKVSLDATMLTQTVNDSELYKQRSICESSEVSSDTIPNNSVVPTTTVNNLTEKSSKNKDGEIYNKYETDTLSFIDHISQVELQSKQKIMHKPCLNQNETPITQTELSYEGEHFRPSHNILSPDNSLKIHKDNIKYLMEVNPQEDQSLYRSLPPEIMENYEMAHIRDMQNCTNQVGKSDQLSNFISSVKNMQNLSPNTLDQMCISETSDKTRQSKDTMPAGVWSIQQSASQLSEMPSTKSPNSPSNNTLFSATKPHIMPTDELKASISHLNENSIKQAPRPTVGQHKINFDEQDNNQVPINRGLRRWSSTGADENSAYGSELTDAVFPKAKSPPFKFRIQSASVNEEQTVEKLNLSELSCNYSTLRQLAFLNPVKNLTLSNKIPLHENSNVVLSSKAVNSTEIEKSDEGVQMALEVLDNSKDILFELTCELFNSTIMTEKKLPELKKNYRKVVIEIRQILLNPKFKLPGYLRKELVDSLEQKVNEYIQIVDQKVLSQFWVPASEKASILRIKADFLRYLVEVNPGNEEYMRRCQLCYKNAKLFFFEHRLQKRVEWVYLQMNYAAFLYLTGAFSAACFISQKLLDRISFYKCDKDIKLRLQSNLKLYKMI